MTEMDKYKGAVARTAHDLWKADTGEGSYRNPVLFADYSDPDVIRVGEDFFMIASSFTYLPGIPLLHSKDLVHWSLVNYCVRHLPFSRYEVPAHGSGTWAPSIRYHKGWFYVFVPLPDEGIFVTKTRDPFGQWSPIKALRHVKGWIDPCPFWDDDGKAYMAFAYAKSRCGIKHKISICEMSPDAQELISEPVTVFEGVQTNPTIEGPKLYKRDGYYYIFAPAGGVENGWQTVLRSENIYGPYDYRIVMHQGNTDINGPHQGGYIEMEDEAGYFLHFQDRGPYGRICHLQPVSWAQGWPFIGQEQNGDGIGEPVSEWEMPVCGEALQDGGQAAIPVSGKVPPDSDQAGIPISDDFDTCQLGLQWQWQANPVDSWYSLLERPGYLRLYTFRNVRREENLLWYAPNACSQLLQAPAFEVTVKLELHPGADGDLCGFGMIGHEYSYLGLAYRNEKYFLELRTGKVTEKQGEGQAEEKVAWSMEEACNKIEIGLDLSEDGTYSYFVCGEKTDIPGRFRLFGGTWTGARLALVSLNTENRPSGGAGDFEYVHYRAKERGI